MPLSALWRRNWAVWAMPASALVLVMLRSNQPDLFDGYPHWAAAQKVYSVIVLGMLTALCGAAEGGWLRRSALVQRPAVRGFLARFVLPVLMAWLPTAALLILAVAVAGGIASVQVWATTLTSLLAWTSVGFALGIALRPAIALPASVVLAFAWFAFTPSVEPPWIRHLTATWDGCCDVYAMPSSAVVVGSFLMSAGLTMASMLVVLSCARNWRPRAIAVAGAVLVTVVGLAASYTLVSRVGYFPISPRTDPVECVSGNPEVCLWSGRRTEAAEIAAQVHAVTDRWRGVGVELPARLSENAVAIPSADAGALIYLPDAPPPLRVEWLAEGLVRGCRELETTESGDELEMYQVKDWLVHHSGTVDIAAAISDQAGLDEILTLPTSTQVKIVNEYLRETREC